MANASFWKIALIIGIILSLVAFVLGINIFFEYLKKKIFFKLGWIGFGVPDWHKFQRYNNSAIEFYGLWAYCQDQNTVDGTVCKRWPTAENELFGGSRPNFVRAAEGLITTGMILLSLGLFAAILAAAIPFLAYLAAGLAFIAFILLVIGLPIFGRQSNNYSATRRDVQYNKRYGFWLMVPTIVLEFLAILFFLAAGLLYRYFGFGNIASSFRTRPPPYGKTIYGGQQRAALPHMIPVPATLGIPYGNGPPVSYGTGGMIAPPIYGTGGMASPSMYSPSLGGRSPYSTPQFPHHGVPSLLSQYLAQRSPQLQGPTIVRSSTLTVLPQPSIIPGPSSSLSGVTPAYLRIAEPVGPRFNPIVNLSGETIIGPIQRSA